MHARSTIASPHPLSPLTSCHSLSLLHTHRLLRNINSDVFHWYASECSFEHASLRQAGVARANKVTTHVRGARPLKMSDAKWLGGHPPGWPYSGCNPSRFRPYPKWPPPPNVLREISTATEHYPGSERFVYFGHGPSSDELQPLINRLSQWLMTAADGYGVDRVPPLRFHQLLKEALAPKWVLKPSAAGWISNQMRRMEEARKLSEGNESANENGKHKPRKHLPLAQRKTLLELVQAKLSIEAFAQEVALMSIKGLRPELATRDNTYYYRWV